MTRKLGIVIAASSSFIISNAFAATTAQQVARLQKMVLQQQRQLAQQSRELKQLSWQLSRQQNRAHQYHPAKLAALPTPSPQIGVVRYVTTPMNQLPVIKQASSATDATLLPGRKLVIGTQKANIALSGQINALAMHADDGNQNDLFWGTNSVANSRLNVNSTFQPSKYWTVGSNMQLGFNVNPSNTVSQTTPSPSPSIDMRIIEVYVKSKRWGTFSFGKGKTASDNTAYSDFSNTMIIGRATVNDIGGGLFFRNKSGALSGTQVADVTNGLDGFSRRYRVRYDTPSWGGFSLATSAAEADRQDVALKFGHEFDGYKVAAQFAATSPQSLNTGAAGAVHGNEVDGSAGIFIPGGFTLSGASGGIIATESGRENPYYFYLKPGYQRQFCRLGPTALSVDMGRYFNFAQNHDRATAYGAQLVQGIMPWNLAMYFGYRLFKLHRAGSSFDHLNLVEGGAYYRF